LLERLFRFFIAWAFRRRRARGDFQTHGEICRGSWCVRATCFIAIVCIAPLPARGQTTWTGAALTTDWNTAGNWSSGLPANNSNAVTWITLPGADVTMSAAGATRGLNIGHTSNALADMPALAITHDLLSGFNGRVEVGLTGVQAAGGDPQILNRGMVRHTAGTLTIGTGATLGERLNIGAAADSYGVYEFGGLAASAPRITGVSGNLNVGTSLRCYGLFSLQDHGSVSIAGNANVSNNGSPAELRVKGGNLDIAITGTFSLGNSWTADGTLRAILTDSPSFSTINVGGDFLLGTQELTGGSNRSRFILELDPSYSHVVGRSFTIVEAGGEFRNRTVAGGVFGNVVDGHRIFVDDYEFIAQYGSSPGRNTFEIVAVPEPSGMGLLAAGAVLMLLRRRVR
jgi:hypothetical protein